MILTNNDICFLYAFIDTYFLDATSIVPIGFTAGPFLDEPTALQ